ncbi:MAG: ATP-binding cassette domain-containing protein [Candidatus Limnocylindrales bacterium]
MTVEEGMTAPARPGGSDLAVAARGLVMRYGSRTALQGLDVSVPRGVVYGFLGPNGAGKTTLMRILVGLIRPDAGSVELLGRPYTWRDRRQLFQVGSLIEQPSFYPYLSGLENLRVIAATGAPTSRNRAEEVLEFVGLTDRSRDKLKTYSLGMKQRLGIAMALLSDPQLLLLDEPANGLDPAGTVAMRELLRYLTAGGKTVLVSSHILPEVQQLADVVGIIDRGRLVREATLDTLLAEGALLRVRVAQEEVDRTLELLATLSPQAETGPVGDHGTAWVSLHVPAEQAGEVNRTLAQAGIFASGLESSNDLEMVFLAATQVAPDQAPPGPPTGWGQPTAPRSP